MENNAASAWERYRKRELRNLLPQLKEMSFELDPTQVHTAGERYLMVADRDVGGGGYKLVLTGTRLSDGKRVVIKVSSHPEGAKEITTERRARETLRALRFAYYVLFSPEEISYGVQNGQTIFITTYIDQEKPFLSRSLKEQFFLALSALKTQEGMHATTSSHSRFIRDTFGIWGADNYLESFATFCAHATSGDPTNIRLARTLLAAQEYLKKHRKTIEQYCGFLTHSDFVPHNLRIEGNTIYLLDYASLHFGNKYESWARFTNFMLLYNRPLERALVEYVRENRTPEELLSLRLMRIYKLGKLLEYYAGTLVKTSGDLHELNKLRLQFWLEVLESLLEESELLQAVIDRYKEARDRLRSPEEKERQKELH